MSAPDDPDCGVNDDDALGDDLRCPTCGGSGRVAIAAIERLECPTCHGSKWLAK